MLCLSANAKRGTRKEWVSPLLWWWCFTVSMSSLERIIGHQKRLCQGQPADFFENLQCFALHTHCRLALRKRLACSIHFPFLLLKSYPTNCISRFTFPDCVLGESSNMSTIQIKTRWLCPQLHSERRNFIQRIRKARQWWLQGSNLFPNSAALLVTPEFLKVLGNTRPSESTQYLLVHVPWLLPK